MKNKKLVFLSTCAAVLSLTACGNKAESNVVETATPAPTATASPAPTAAPVPENHSIDTAIDTYKNENAIEINPDDIGTDISDIDSLHDWLYNNGVDRTSVQNDRDSGCKNPYLDGYLEYLDNLDKPSEDAIQPVSKSVDLSNATVHSGSEFGTVADVDVYEVDGKYYTEDGHELKYDTKHNEWYVDLTEEFAGKKFDMTGEEVAEENKKAEENGQKVKEAMDSGELDDIIMKHHVGY